MLEHAPERRRALDVAGQADRGRVEVGGDGHRCVLGPPQDRLDRQVVVERLAAAAVDVADGGADLGVGVGVDVLLEEVDQPAVALEDGEDAEVGAGRRAEKRGSTRAANSGSVRVFQNALRARTKRFKGRLLAAAARAAANPARLRGRIPTSLTAGPARRKPLARRLVAGARAATARRMVDTACRRGDIVDRLARRRAAGPTPRAVRDAPRPATSTTGGIAPMRPLTTRDEGRRPDPHARGARGRQRRPVGRLPPEGLRDDPRPRPAPGRGRTSARSTSSPAPASRCSIGLRRRVEPRAGRSSSSASTRTSATCCGS